MLPKPNNNQWPKPEIVLAISLAVSLVLAGCAGQRRQEPPELNLAEIIAHVNANNQQITQFASKNVNLMIKFKDDKQISRRYDLAGASLIYQRPTNLYLSANHLGGPALRIGSNADRYWLGVVPEQNTLWWGNWINVDKSCSGRLYIQPDKLIEALGVGLLSLVDQDFFVGPMLQRRQEANVLIYGAWDDSLQYYYTAREIHLQRREPFLISQIIYYQPHGKETLRITLDRYGRLGSDGPLLAHRLEMHWPQQGGVFRADLNWVKTDRQISSRTFKFPDTAPYDHAFQV